MRTKIMRLANKISLESKSGIVLSTSAPEYRILDPVVTDDMADVAMALKVRKEQTLEQIAAKCGKPREETKRLLWDLSKVGAAMMATDVDGVEKYQMEIWVPGIMEVMVNTKENYTKFPDIARCFEEYTRKMMERLGPLLPMGTGGMRVIPVEQVISGEHRIASYEQVSTYLEKYDLFAVADCSCRTVREVMGEGCGHLKEDMCLILGRGAEFFIRTGKGRQINRKEAYEVIRKAEELGFVHQITNWEGQDEALGICNCCGCSCLSLRVAQYHKLPDVLRSNYVSHIDKNKCVACGACVENCQVNALRLGQSLCSKTPIVEEKHDHPSDTIWGKSKMDPDYRIHRKDVVESGTSPCKSECPAHIAIQGYIRLASQGKYRDALELIKNENPFPAVCGRICPRGCESACTRGDIDEPIAIDDIKKFIAEQDLNAAHRYVPKRKHDYGKKIAVIGAGPSGLSCAYYLAVDGYKVTVFEKQPVLGGMLTLGIPSFRLEKDVIHAEIDILKELGVEFKTGIEVGKDITLKELRSQGYEAFYLAIGAQAGRKVGIEGEDAEGVITGVDFLQRVNLGNDIQLKGKVVVIGGGNVAIDVARAARRVGSSLVAMYCLEKREEMPALAEEIEEATSEDIAIHNSWGPKRVITKQGKVAGIEFKRCIKVFDEQGQFNPRYDENDTKIIDADYVLISVGQAMDWGNLIAGSKIELNPNKTVKADPFTLQTDEPDIFAGGDALTGPKYAIDAIAMGKEGAISIHRFVHPGQSLILGRDRRDYHALDKTNVVFKGFDTIPRQKAGHADGTQAKESFKDLRGILTEEQIKKETERCLGCGASIVDEHQCVGCGICATKCKFDAITLFKKYDQPGTVYEDVVLKQAVQYSIKRGAKIASKMAKNVIKSISHKE